MPRRHWAECSCHVHSWCAVCHPLGFLLSCRLASTLSLFSILPLCARARPSAAHEVSVRTSDSSADQSVDSGRKKKDKNRSVPPPSEAKSKKPLPGLNRSPRGAEQLLRDSFVILGDFKTLMPEALNNASLISQGKRKVSKAVKSIIFLKMIPGEPWPLRCINLHNLQ